VFTESYNPRLLLNTFTAPHNFHILPMSNPDGFSSEADQPSHQQQIRKNMPGYTQTNFAIASILVAACLVGAPMAASAQSGVASIYSGGLTANGERAAASGLTAAHRTLPFGTLVRVTNQSTGRSVVVRINDRGPFVRGRVIDLTPAGARALGFSGLANVTLDIVGHGRS
jgi:rare lipoprotein A